MVYIPPDEVLRFGKQISNTYSSGALDALGRDRLASQQALIQAELQAQAEKDKLNSGGGFVDSLKQGAGDVLNALDTGRAALVATGHAIGLEGRNLLRGENNDVAGTFASDIQNHIGAGQVIEQAFPNAPQIMKQAGGGALDIGADPLNALTFGAGSEAKAAEGVLGRALGPDLARQAARGGVEDVNRVLAERAAAENAARVPAGAGVFDTLQAKAATPLVTAPTVESTLRDAIPELGRRSVDDTVARQLKVLDKGGAGGIGYGGFQTGIGQDAFDKYSGLLKNIDVMDKLRGLVVPTKDVASEIDVHAAKAVDMALHTGEAVRHEAIRRGEIFTSAAEKGGLDLGDLPDKVYAMAKDQASQGMADDLRRLVPRVVSDVAAPGTVEIAPGTFVPQVIGDTIKRASDAMPSQVLQGVDAGLNWLKRLTTLGPLNAVPHVGRNIMSNHLFAAMFGGVVDPRYWEESRLMRRGLNEVLSAKEIPTAERLTQVFADHPEWEGKLTFNLSPEQRGARAVAMHDQGLIGRGAKAFDDVGGGAEARKAMLGTRTASKVNEWHEELSRGTVFLKGLDDGLDPAAASLKSRQAMLDYSNVGLTPEERKYAQRIVFFYKFPRRAVPEGLRFMVHTPGLALSASKAGVGVAEGTRNQYGQKIGTYLDTPLEAMFQNINDVGSDPTSVLNPVLKALVDPNSRSLDKLVPVLGQGERGASDPGSLGYNTAIGAVGLREGQDYATDRAKAKFQTAFQSRGAQGLAPTPTDQIRQLADQAGLKDAYTSGPGTLAQELIALGKSPRDIGMILAGRAG